MSENQELIDQESCKEELYKDLSDDQKNWYCHFKRLFSKDYQNQLEFLKSCSCFDEKEWKQNFKHVLHKVLNDECTAYNEIIKNMINMKNSGIEKLILTSLVLKNIPTVIESQIQLKTLIINDMEIHLLPTDLKNLTNLNILQITKCPIYEFPEWIGQLINLTKLNFSRCRISKISPTISKCIQLSSIDLKFNIIKEFPNERLEFPNLQRLDVEGNPIIINWENLNIPNLIVLNISQTNITSIPDIVSTNLNILSWNCVRDIKIPNFGQELIYIHLSGSILDRTPIEIFSFPNIKYINIPFTENITKEDIEKIRSKETTLVIYKIK